MSLIKAFFLWEQAVKLSLPPTRKMSPKEKHGPINRLKNTVKCGKNPNRKVWKLNVFG